MRQQHSKTLKTTGHSHNILCEPFSTKKGEYQKMAADYRWLQTL